MFLDKFINRYSYNILSILGYIELVFFLISTHPYAYEYFFLEEWDGIFAIVLVTCLLLVINIVVSVIIGVFIFVEKKKNLQIENPVLNKNIIKYIIHLGFIFWLCPFLYLIYDVFDSYVILVKNYFTY
jgi:uncharacterized protein YneF (UPF0154 family)